MTKKEQISIRHESDVNYATDQARFMSKQLGFGKTQSITISVAVSELASNIFKYGQEGSIVIESISNSNKSGIQVTAEDYGPGIHDISEALRDGFSSKDTLGLGLSGVYRLMDEFEFDKKRSIGTKIVVIKWI